jgi:hypothetical protein
MELRHLETRFFTTWRFNSKTKHQWISYLSFKVVQNLTHWQNIEEEKILGRQKKLQILSTNPYKMEIMLDKEEKI